MVVHHSAFHSGSVRCQPEAGFNPLTFLPNTPSVFEYYYLGDKNTAAALRRAKCSAVRQANGKCIRGKNGSMLVRFENGEKHVIVGRLLRKFSKPV